MGGKQVKLIAGGNACSKYKELVDKVYAALKVGIKEAQADTPHGMPLLSEILTAFVRKSRKLSRFHSAEACHE